MRPFLGQLRPARHLPAHLSLVMIREIPREEAHRLALEGSVCGIEDPALAEAVRRDLDASLPDGKWTVPLGSAWEAVLVDVRDGVPSYWLLMVR